MALEPEPPGHTECAPASVATVSFALEAAGSSRWLALSLGGLQHEQGKSHLVVRDLESRGVRGSAAERLKLAGWAQAGHRVKGACSQGLWAWPDAAAAKPLAWGQISWVWLSSCQVLCMALPGCLTLVWGSMKDAHALLLVVTSLAAARLVGVKIFRVSWQ